MPLTVQYVLEQGILLLLLQCRFHHPKRPSQLYSTVQYSIVQCCTWHVELQMTTLKAAQRRTNIEGPTSYFGLSDLIQENALR